ncbi:MAG: hypothetical protein MUC48_24700 [Leptolyngbya sp. Prado105]|nr:hypothetical protein [Leptolyngbya sp. Prado105]
MRLDRKSIESLLKDRPLALNGSTGRWKLLNIHSNAVVFEASKLSEIRDRITILLGV